MKKKLLIFLLFALTIESFSCRSAVTNETKTLLQGKWISFQDSNYSMVIKKDFILERYEGSNEGESFLYSLSKKNCGVNFDMCNNNCYYLIKIDTVDNNRECYLIKNLTNNSLTLIYEGGAVLDFIRPVSAASETTSSATLQ